MGRKLAQVRNANGCHSIGYALLNQLSGVATDGQSPGNIVFNHGGYDLVIGVLEDHTDGIADDAPVGLIVGKISGHSDVPLVWDKQGVAVAGQGRFATAVMSK